MGSVLFQLPKVPAKTNISVAMRKEIKLIVFISKWLVSAETRYWRTEREELAILESQGKVQWLIFGSPYTTKVYTDHSLLVGLLKKDDSNRRIVKWQVTLSKYNIKYLRICGKENRLADGLSHMEAITSMITEVGKALDECLEIYALERDSTSTWEEWLQDE